MKSGLRRRGRYASLTLGGSPPAGGVSPPAGGGISGANG